MNPWFRSVRRWDLSVPLEPIQSYTAINRFMEYDPGPADSSTRRKGNSTVETRTVVQHDIKNFVRNVAAFVHTAQDVTNEAARLHASDAVNEREQQTFVASVNRLLEQAEPLFRRSDPIEMQEDNAHIQSFEQFVSHWEQKAALILATPPLELADDEALPFYAAYSKHRQKTRYVPHQGWLLQTFG